MSKAAYQRTKISLILMLGGLAAMGPLSIDMYLPAFEAIGEELHTTAGPLGATLATFFAGLCLGQLVYGPLSDKVGRKKPLIFGLSLYIFASLVCAMSQNIETLLVFRFIQAFGSCAGMVIGRALVRDLFEPEETARVFSLVMLTMGVAPILAPLLGQWITAGLGWRAIFIGMTLFACLVGLAVLRILPDGERKAGKTWNFGVFLALLKDQRFLGFALSGTFIQAGLFAYITGSPHLFLERLDFSPKQFSLLFGLNAMGLIAASQLNTFLLKRWGFEKVLAGVLPFSLGAAVLLLTGSELTGESLLVTVLPLFVFVSSLGLVFPNSTAGALSEQGKRAGSASAVLGTIQYGGAALASAVVGWLHQFTPAAMEWTIAGCAILSWLIFYRLLGSTQLATGGKR